MNVNEMSGEMLREKLVQEALALVEKLSEKQLVKALEMAFGFQEKHTS